MLRSCQKVTERLKKGFSIIANSRLFGFVVPTGKMNKGVFIILFIKIRYIYNNSI